MSNFGASLQNYQAPTMPQLGADQIFLKNQLQQLSKSINLLVTQFKQLESEVTTNSGAVTNVPAGDVIGNATGSTATAAPVTPKIARSSALLNIESVTNVGDTNYTILATDRVVNSTLNFTAPRTWTLPAVSSVNPGTRLTIIGIGANGANTGTLAAAGLDQIYDVVANTVGASLVFRSFNSFDLVSMTIGGTSYWCIQYWGAQAAGRNYVFVNLNGTNVTGIANNVTTKVPLNNKVADPDGVFDAVTNHRFTPNVAGKYLIAGAVGFATTGATPPLIFEAASAIFKNGASLVNGMDWAGGTSTSGMNYGVAPVTAIVQMNGSTDYIELYVYINYFGATANVAGILGANADTYLTATWIGP
jgi:hypothetical protein